MAVQQLVVILVCSWEEVSSRSTLPPCPDQRHVFLIPHLLHLFYLFPVTLEVTTQETFYFQNILT